MRTIAILIVAVAVAVSVMGVVSAIPCDPKVDLDFLAGGLPNLDTPPDGTQAVFPRDHAICLPAEVASAANARACAEHERVERKFQPATAGYATIARCDYQISRFVPGPNDGIAAKPPAGPNDYLVINTPNGVCHSDGRIKIRVLMVELATILPQLAQFCDRSGSNRVPSGPGAPGTIDLAFNLANAGPETRKRIYDQIPWATECPKRSGRDTDTDTDATVFNTEAIIEE